MSATAENAAIAPCPRTRWEVALSLLFQHVRQADRGQRVRAVIDLFQSGHLAPDGLRVLQRAGSIEGAIVSQVLPGAAALLWPPQVRQGGHREADEDRLLQETSNWLRAQGVKLGQSMLDPHEEDFGLSLERNGFAALTRLWVLHHDGNIPVELLANEERLRFVTYSDPWRETFNRVMMESFEATLDCPEINGVRTVDEVLEGHRASGTYSPDRWWLALDGKEPVGVVIATPLTGRPVWELTYLGLIPSGRGRKLGRELVLKVLWEARAAGVSDVELTVDQRNTPAWNVYRRLGFEVIDQRRVYMAIWHRPNQGTPS